MELRNNSHHRNQRLFKNKEVFIIILRNSKKFVLLALVLGTLILGACAQQEPPKKAEQPQKQVPENIVGVIFDQWKNSGHAVAVEADNPSEAPGMNEGGKCFLCHNGYAFERKADSLKGIGILKGTSCDTCHTGYGQSLLEKGSVTIPLGDIKGGKGSLCMSCHSGRGKIPDQKSAPHHSVQTDVLLSKSGAEVTSFNYGKSPHLKGTDTCIECHMAAGKDGVKDHTFKMKEENVNNSCGECHSFKTLNPPAKEDYDGDGETKGIQDEVTGLLEIVKTTVDNQLNGGKFSSGGGKIIFEDAQGNPLEAPPSPEVYNAAWNYFLVSFDGSKGVHNPAYAVQLLQQTYKALTGTDVPEATIRK